MRNEAFKLQKGSKGIIIVVLTTHVLYFQVLRSHMIALFVKRDGNRIDQGFSNCGLRDPLVGCRVGQGGSHKVTWLHLNLHFNDTHTPTVQFRNA